MNIASMFLGAIVTVISFALLDFTYEVTHRDVERAMSVCKEAKWRSINNTQIICVDGATYSRRVAK